MAPPPNKQPALPADESTWLAAVSETLFGGVRLRDVPLGDMSEKTFSGSTIPYEACLQLRALWPPTRIPDQARHELEGDGRRADLSLFNKRDADLAASLLERSQRLNHFLSITAGAGVAENTDPTTTPVAGQSTLDNADILGMFVPSVLSWRKLRTPPGQEHHRPLYTPKARRLDPGTHFRSSQPVSKLDFSRPSKQIPSEDDTEHRSGLEDDEADASKSSEDRPGALWAQFDRLALSPSVTTRRNAAPSASAVPRVPPEVPVVIPACLPLPPSRQATEASSRSSKPRPVYSRRTEYEVQTSHFFVTYLDTLLGHALSLGVGDHISVIAQEKQYKFGSKKTAETSNPGRGDAFFVACPDGAIYTHVNVGDRRPFMFFELKPFRRDTGPRGQLICREETAEMAAIIYQEYVAGHRKLPRDSTQNYREYMLSLDQDDFWLISVSFTGRYLEYLADARNLTGTDDMGHGDFVVFQRYGPFRITSRIQMRPLNVIVVAAAIAQLRETSSGPQLLKRLEAELATSVRTEATK